MRIDKNALIYVIDDEDLIAEIVCDLITELGYNSKRFNSANHAIELLNSEKPDLIITDFKMPEVDGVELVNILREKRIEIPTLFLSAHLSKDIIAKIIECGCSGYIEKPIRPGHFKSIVKSVLSKSLYLRTVESKLNQFKNTFFEFEKKIVGQSDLNDILLMKQHISEMELSLRLYKSTDNFFN